MSRQTGKAWYKSHLAAIRKSNSRPRTAEWKRKLGLAHKGAVASVETRRKMSKSHRKRFNDLAEDQCEMCGSTKHTYAQHQSRLCAGRRRSGVWKTSVQGVLRKRFADGGKPIRFPALYCKGDVKLTMQSSWEVAFAKKLDEVKIEWVYEPRSFFVGKGKWFGKHYLPDFYLPELNCYVEIKGHLYRHSKRKLTAFHSKYPLVNWLMLRKNDLEAIGCQL